MTRNFRMRERLADIGKLLLIIGSIGVAAMHLFRSLPEGWL